MLLLLFQCWCKRQLRARRIPGTACIPCIPCQVTTAEGIATALLRQFKFWPIFKCAGKCPRRLTFLGRPHYTMEDWSHCLCPSHSILVDHTILYRALPCPKRPDQIQSIPLHPTCIHQCLKQLHSIPLCTLSMSSRLP